jgi:hypothetical protein
MQSAPQAPAPPDPYATSAAQTQGDVQSAIANTAMGNANTYTPFGSVQYNQIGTTTIRDAQGKPIDVPRYESRQTLSPEQQRLYEGQTQLGAGMNDLALSQVNRLGGVLGQPISTNGLPAATTSIGSGPNLQTSLAPAGAIQSNVNLQRAVGSNDFSKDRDLVTQALMSRIQPELDRSQGALDAKLANQGINAGSTAYTDANVAQGRTANDARMQAILAGSQEQSRLFGLDLQRGQFANDATLAGAQFANGAQAQQFGQSIDRANFGNNAQQQMFSNAAMGATFGNTARERALQETLAIRNQPINEVSALMNGGQVTAPQFSQFQGGQIAGSTIGQNIMGAAQLANQQYNTAAQSAAANNAGIYGLGSAALGMGGSYLGRK